MMDSAPIDKQNYSLELCTGSNGVVTLAVSATGTVPGTVYHVETPPPPYLMRACIP